MQEPDLGLVPDDAAPSETPKKPRVVIPVWVALAAMVLAVVVAGVIISSIAEPLLNLISPEKPDIPLPPGTHLEKKDEESNYATTEWLYGSKLPGCEVAAFFDQHEGVECIYTPMACPVDVEATATPEVEPTPTPEGGTITANFSQVAVCSKQVKEVASSYTWRVDIFDGYSGEYRTKFRIYLFSER